MTAEEKNICDSIHTYINEELYDWLDNDIFTKTSYEELGELYYNHVLYAVEKATGNLLNSVIRTIKPHNFICATQNDYYIALCKILHIKRLPSTIIIDVKNEYDNIFIHRYNTVVNKYQTELSRINNEHSQIQYDSDVIRNTKPSYSLMRDITTDEQKLYQLCSTCNSLRTRKEMLEFAMTYTTTKLSEFCDINDAQSVDTAIKQETLKLCSDNMYNVDFLFTSYRDYVDLLEDDIDRPYLLFYKIKIYVIIERANQQYRYSYYNKTEDEAISEYKDYLSNVPKIDDLHSYKNSNPSIYNNVLEKLIIDYSLIDRLIDNLEKSVCLRERKNILIKAVDLYKQGEYEIFNNLLPIQIEGMFADYLKETTTFLRFSKMEIYQNAVLKDKIRHLQEVNSDIYPEAVEYFMYYFNNMIRNRIAHGKYYGSSTDNLLDEIFAKELLLDMGMLVHMLSRKSETEKMYRFIHGYQNYYKNVIHSDHPCFGALFNDMIGNKLVADYDTMERYRPMQVVYWLVNPYYEKIYEKVADKCDLIELRNEFLSKDFWEYVLSRLSDVIQTGYDYLNIDDEFPSIVKGLFKCGISSEVKQLLGKVNSALHDIQIMHTNL